MSFIEFARGYGLLIDKVIATGRIIRVSTVDGKGGNRDGAYCFYDDDKGLSGWLKNHRTGEYAVYYESSNNYKRLPAEVVLKQKIEEESCRKAVHDKSAKIAEYLVRKIFKPAVKHPYLTKKQIQPHNSLIDKYGALIIPLKNIYGNIRSFVRITEEGFKSYLKDSEKRGCFYQFSPVEDKVIICEGFATGASIYEGTGIATLSAMDAGNLEKVAIAVRNKYGSKLDIIIAGDNDHHLSSNIGEVSAMSAAKSCNGRYIIPDFNMEEKQQRLTDFNDLKSNRKDINLKQYFYIAFYLLIYIY